MSQKLVHRDIKPSNIMMNVEEEGTFKPEELIRYEVARPHHFIPFKRREHSETPARAGASGSPVRCAGVARQFIVIWFDRTQPSPLFPMASTGHPSMASLQSASSSGVVGCLNT